ncbi:hypothetical protein EJ04DRAFT_509475 [Polyplosphaeria fusca]|uniref:MARVEL domain-containing protein n=1 Tax=Polyplosphaeria fusca TaxID=682080 RepID=A0A9P4R8B8_9PLEO|nr:hypothetical protein EJ04DRAFT_509475 [Polyplosphaeria fusca]
MRIPQSYIQKCKVVAHVFQVLFIFVSGCITIAVFTKGSTGGASKYFFALCFLSLPALIYLVMVPMWSRASRFANAYAFLALDALYTIFWFAAFVSVAVWNTAGIRDGEKEKKIKDGDGNCSTFAPGPEDMCTLSRATVGLGAVVFIFFGITTAVSAYYLVKFRKEGILPYESKEVNPHHASGETAAKDNAWSAEIENGRDSDDEDRRTERGGNQEEDEYALLHSTETDEGRHPGRPLSWGDNRFRDPVPPYAHDDNANALSPGGYEEYRRDAGAGAQHPDAFQPRYDEGGYDLGGQGEYNNAPHAPQPQGYSFTGGDR